MRKYEQRSSVIPEESGEIAPGQNDSEQKSNSHKFINVHWHETENVELDA